MTTFRKMRNILIVHEEYFVVLPSFLSTEEMQYFTPNRGEEQRQRCHQPDLCHGHVHLLDGRHRDPDQEPPKSSQDDHLCRRALWTLLHAGAPHQHAQLSSLGLSLGDTQLEELPHGLITTFPPYGLGLELNYTQLEELPHRPTSLHIAAWLSTGTGLHTTGRTASRSEQNALPPLHSSI
ncbi:hypothetical protein CDAR_4101 [Caerostris darwini]|uniref:Uncharacterized protein n=1 Tax=Caerostris darwini TaxID=1538125 RepID=A0AAV4WY41_9ARAC|nr:hypothetical protein CDAR_4101 [Caerostris darwini]